MLTWPKMVLLALFVLLALTNIAQIGKPRRPLEPGAVVIATVLQGVICWLIIIA